MGGYDTRFLSEKYAESVASVLASNGIPVVLSDRAVPTPSVSYYILQHGLIGGVNCMEQGGEEDNQERLHFGVALISTWK